MGWSPFRATGLTHHRTAGSFKGYTLVTPMGGADTLLLDMDGAVVHRWHFAGMSPWYGRLLPGGNLLVMGNERANPGPPPDPSQPPLPFSERVQRLGGIASMIREVTWDGEMVWDYAEAATHHDFVRLENGNTLLMRWVEMPEEHSRRVRGGRRAPPRLTPSMLCDVIFEIDPSGKEVWSVDLAGLLDPRRDTLCPIEGRAEWTHTNSLDVNADGDILFSCRANSIVGVIGRSTKKLTWKVRPDEFSHQHHASWLANGHIQVFDNGSHSGMAPRSRVIELDIATNEVVWQFTGEPAPQFFSHFLSGADHLPNGNVLVCEGVSGRVFEVTRRSEVVWEWVSPFAHDYRDTQVTQLFRAHRYGPDHPAVAGRELDPAAHAQLNHMHGLAYGGARRWSRRAR